MRDAAPLVFVAALGAIVPAAVVRSHAGLASDPSTSQAVRDRAPAASRYVLDCSADRVFIRMAPAEFSVQNRDGTGATLLYRGPDQSQIRWVRPSPVGGFVAVEEVLAGEDRPGKRRVHLLEDRGGVVQRTIPDVVEFVWSPNGQAVAYTTGTYERLERPTSTGVWILSMPSGTPRRVNVDGDYLFWARFDGALYIRDWRPADRTVAVLRYDPVSGELSETPHRSIYFSPSGRYYHNFGSVYEGRFDVFVTANDRGLSAGSTVLRGLPSMVPPLAWAPDADLLLIPIRDRSFVERGLIYDPSSDTATIVAGADLIGWSTQAGELAYWEGGRVVSKRIEEVIVKRRTSEIANPC